MNGAATNATLTTQAQEIVTGYGFSLGTGTNQANVAATSVTFATKSGVRVTISRPQSTLFSSVYLPTLSDSVTATAVLNGGGGSEYCLLALGQTSTGANEANAIDFQGNVSLNVGNNCGIYSDSGDCVNGAVSVFFQGNPTITTGSLGTAGCLHMGGSAQVNLPGGVTCTPSDSAACPDGGGGIVYDPYAGMTLPSTPAAPRFALTLWYASQTTCLEITYDFASGIDSSPVGLIHPFG